MIQYYHFPVQWIIISWKHLNQNTFSNNDLTGNLPSNYDHECTFRLTRHFLIRYFRMISAEMYLDGFSSDRSHMVSNKIAVTQ